MPVQRSAKIPEAILHLQQQLDQWRGAQKGRTKLPESFWQHPSLGEAIWSIPNGATTASGLHEAEAAAERSGTAARVFTAGICGTGQAAPRKDGRVRHRVRIGAGRQDARSMEIQHPTRLDKPVAGLAGWRPVIQITAQMRVLVAIEPVDGRKYAPSIDMRSLSKPGLQGRGLLRRKPSCSHEQLRIT